MLDLPGVVASCLETVRERWEASQARVLEWTQQSTLEDAGRSLGSQQLLFLTLLAALSDLNTQMCAVLLKEVAGCEDFFSRVRQTEWTLPRPVLDRAARFAALLERRGMFAIPQELHSLLAELLSESQSSLLISESPEAVDKPTAAPLHEALITSTTSKTEETPNSEANKASYRVSSHFTVEPFNLLSAEVERLESELPCGPGLEDERPDGMTALAVAARDGRVGAVRALLGAVDLEARDRWGMTALHWGAACGREAVVGALLGAGASVGAADRDGWTPLHHAAAWGHLSSAALLVEAGADPAASNDDGDTPLDLAEYCKDTQLAEYLRSLRQT